MSKFTNAIKGMSKLKKAMTAMWLIVASTLIALVAVLITFGDKVSGKDRALDGNKAAIAQYKVTNPEISYHTDASNNQVQNTVAPLDIEQLAFDSATDVNYKGQADALSRFQTDVKARSSFYVAKFNTKTNVGNFFLKGSKAEKEATAIKGWGTGIIVKNAKTNEEKIVGTKPTSTDWTVVTQGSNNEIITSDLDGGIPELIPASSTGAGDQSTLYYTISRIKSTIDRTVWEKDVTAKTVTTSVTHTDSFAIVFQKDAFAFNDEAKNKSNATAAVGTIFALSLVGAIGVTVAESIYRKRGAK